ncbi:MAG: hypothetical protein H0X25_03410 [Acidobacteriales bacterium]|nr:hypothetical protein [Terriglobales bacterium]
MYRSVVRFSRRANAGDEIRGDRELEEEIDRKHVAEIRSELADWALSSGDPSTDNLVIEVYRHSEERHAKADRLFLVYEVDQRVGDMLGVCQRSRLPEASIEFLEQRVVGRVVNVRDVAAPLWCAETDPVLK